MINLAIIPREYTRDEAEFSAYRLDRIRADIGSGAAADDIVEAVREVMRPQQRLTATVSAVASINIPRMNLPSRGYIRSYHSI